MAAHTGIPLPPTAFAAAAILQRLAPKATAKNAGPPLRRSSAALLAAGSAALMVCTLGAFRSHGTTIDPTSPEQATVLVLDGPNKFSRNPMYVGMLGILAAHALLRGAWQAWLPVAAFAATLDRVQIPHEERALLEKFGAEFENYRARTPCWLGTPRAWRVLTGRRFRAARRTHSPPGLP